MRSRTDPIDTLLSTNATSPSCPLQSVNKTMTFNDYYNMHLVDSHKKISFTSKKSKNLLRKLKTFMLAGILSYVSRYFEYM